jgi:hypothetical protein
MAYYLIHYTVGADNQFVYPKSVAGVVWKSTVYHFKDHVLVGETDQRIKADGKTIIGLKAPEFQEQTKALQASFPKAKDPDAPRSVPR